jgi:hypothetical protein
MNIVEALRLCKDGGRRVRPLAWRSRNPAHWIEWRQGFFVEGGTYMEIPHALRLQREDEFLGDWEFFEPEKAAPVAIWF